MANIQTGSRTHSIAINLTLNMGHDPASVRMLRKKRKKVIPDPYEKLGRRGGGTLAPVVRINPAPYAG